MALPILAYALERQSDVVGARQRARQVAQLLGFDAGDQTRIATSVSEIARNAFRYAGGGKVEFEVVGESAPQLLVVRVSDQGPGIERLDEVLEGTYQSATGMGIGIIGSRRLVDRWEIHSRAGEGTVVTLGKLLPAGAPLVTGAAAGRVAGQLAAMPPPGTAAEIQAQNAELLATLAQLQQEQERRLEMARELEDTNRGVVALYAELDEKAVHLRRADEMKSRFLSNMSHEFRTPLNSVRALCGLLLDQVDGPLNAEQERQVRFIAKAAGDLSELVNDLLDLAKIEAGKIEVRPMRFEAAELFSALRGMLRPLLAAETVELVFDEPRDLPPLHTDESKVSQILRNFISNALKFTERGEVRVQALAEPGGRDVVFSVRDTGIGIAPGDQEMIFEEFTQVPGPVQRKVHGTGLGLPLCRRLAGLLGGAVWVESEPGRGSTFFARIPARYAGEAPAQPAPEAPPPPVPQDRPWVLVIEDEEAQRLVYEKYLEGTRYAVVGVGSLAAALALMRAHRPAAIILDLRLPGEEDRTWRWLSEIKNLDEPIPVVVVSEAQEERKARSLGADAYFAKPVGRGPLIDALDRLVDAGAGRVGLIIDDDEASRYVIRRSLRRAMRFEEAHDGASGLKAAARHRPDVIFLDLSMPGMQGDEVLRRLKQDPDTAGIPVIVVTSREVDEALRERLGGRAREILHKRELSIESLEAAMRAIGLGTGT